MLACMYACFACVCMPGVSSFILHIIDWSRISCWSQSLPSWLGWIGSQLWRPRFHLCLLCTRITAGCHAHPVFMWALDLNCSLYTSTASALTTEQSLSWNLWSKSSFGHWLSLLWAVAELFYREAELGDISDLSEVTWLGLGRARI